MSKPLGHASINFAELMVPIEGLRVYKDLKIIKLEIEGDSAIIINALRKGNMPNWKLKSFLSIALSLISSFKKCTFNYIFREGN